jgi:hypothetical protein
MIANAKLSHFPTADWKCYKPQAGAAAARSLLALGGTGARAVDMYMEDAGDHNAAVGHRRWILFPPQQTMGSGDTTKEKNNYHGSNSIYAIGTFGTRPAGQKHVAWPPAGYVPAQVIWDRWSFSYPRADFSSASVTMNVTGAGNPHITMEPVEIGYGDNTVVWKPAYWLPNGERSTSKDVPVNVEISNVVVDGKPMTFSYTVIVMNPAQGSTVTKTDALDALLTSANKDADANGDGIIDAADMLLAQ